MIHEGLCPFDKRRFLSTVEEQNHQDAMWERHVESFGLWEKPRSSIGIGVTEQSILHYRE